MRTSLTEMLGLDHPIVQAPIGGLSNPKLAAAVSNAGGLGTIAMTWTEPEVMRARIRETRSLTDRPFGVNLILEWPQEERVEVALEEGVRVLSFFWGDPAPHLDRIHEAGAIVMLTVGTAAEAERAVDAGVDVIVAQGWEAGGHVWGNVATLPLVASVTAAVPSRPVIAAGGIADGRGLAAVLALGAAGAWLGTRFAASVEAGAHPDYLDRLIAARESDTVYGVPFDIGWPDAPHRVLRNATVAAWEAAGRPRAGTRPGEGDVVARDADGESIQRYSSAAPRADVVGDMDAYSLWAGQSAGLIHDVRPAAEIVRTIAADADAILRRLVGL